MAPCVCLPSSGFLLFFPCSLYKMLFCHLASKGAVHGMICKMIDGHLALDFQTLSLNTTTTTYDLHFKLFILSVELESLARRIR